MVKRLALPLALIALSVIVSAQGRRGVRTTVARVPDAHVYCNIGVSPSSASDPATLTTHTLTVTAAAGCAWTAISNDSFISVTSGASGTGNGSIGLSVAANTGSSRIGSVTITGSTFTETQAGASGGGGGCVGATSASYVPCASGPGMSTRAAWACGGNPVVYRVTNLNDTGTGSLRAALEANEPLGRLVIFEISGTITSAHEINVNKGCLTVAGQTAPSPGILMKGFDNDAGIEIHDADVVLQHFRIRPGSQTCNAALGVWDNANYAGTNGAAQRIVFDHMSVSWGVDEGIYFANRYRAVNATVWRSIMAEGLEGAVGGNIEPCLSQGATNGHGLLVYVKTGPVAVIQSVSAHNLERSFYCAEGCSIYASNNIIYDAHEGALSSQGLWDNQFGAPGPVTHQATLSTYIGNYFKRGSQVRTMYADYKIGFYGITSGTSSKMWDVDNTLDDGTVLLHTDATALFNGSIDPRTSTTSAPVTVAGYTPMTAATTYTFVPPIVGARPKDRDSVDTRIMADVVSASRSGGNISDPASVGGYPSLAVNVRALTLPANPNTVTASGYTNTELWLQNYATLLEQ